MYQQAKGNDDSNDDDDDADDDDDNNLRDWSRMRMHGELL